jgi:hypothetical protein
MERKACDRALRGICPRTQPRGRRKCQLRGDHTEGLSLFEKFRCCSRNCKKVGTVCQQRCVRGGDPDPNICRVGHLGRPQNAIFVRTNLRQRRSVYRSLQARMFRCGVQRPDRRGRVAVSRAKAPARAQIGRDPLVTPIIMMSPSSGSPTASDVAISPTAPIVGVGGCPGRQFRYRETLPETIGRIQRQAALMPL